MTARLIDGKALAETARRSISERVRTLRAAGVEVHLDAVLAASGHDSSSRVYAENQAKTCREVGIGYKLHELPAGATEQQVAEQVAALGEDPKSHAIMVHMPVPKGIDSYAIQSLINPRKDVEGVNPVNIGNIVYGRSSLIPCTSLAVLKMIESTGVELRGTFAVCVGAGDIVGKPIAVLLMRHEATVVSCNKFTDNITDLTRKADILIVAAGKPGLVKGDWIKPGAIVVDVGISRLTDAGGKTRTVGDVDQEEAIKVAGWLSPVPGGVGPMTVAMLLENVVSAAEGLISSSGR
ncbi:MAG TPA: bifunctional 5,10-methylenetetrahydrofolate dehydrogenase/5,10-methenyltetrahydrofolate cyclohydrolase [Phycisphaerales bacterium]|nr:bifunctional 5,10-methylenetetrahydrofolate dehydrogenase/5,10-methenyltetrahydrofolate cyclohydrolase [Phycisphaerales bacterium]